TDTWLRDADVVLIDAPNTGVGRIAKPEYGSRFFGMRQDIQAFTRFIRNYLTQYERWRSPLYLAGESYGGVRTAGLARSLYDDGIAINGAIVISGLMNYGTVRTGPGNDVPYVGFFPTLAQTAWYHKKLSPAWQAKPVEEIAKAAEAFASGPYQQALFKGDVIPENEKKSIAARYAELTGLSAQYVLRANLRVTEGRFFKELLRDRGQTVGRFDSRIVGQDKDDAGEGAEFDPSDATIEAPFSSTIVDLITRELNYRSETPYKTWGDIGRWENPQGTYADTSENLRQAMARNPDFRILFAVGRYDMACPYFATRYNVEHMGLRPEQAKRVEWTYYPAGHMMYIEKGSRERLTRDISDFIKRTH
ncbi:peptidase S10, partial [bacterium]